MSVKTEVHLPDEILSEILAPALRVPEDAFSSTAEPSPFASSSESSSAFLLVSKSWLRVSTPLLYHVVVLRSKAQAGALRTALSRNPDLGRFIKKLRVEGGFGKHMHDILKAAPNITDIFLSLKIYSSDSTPGLVSGLPLINPTRLIVFDSTRARNVLRNKAVDNLMRAIETCVVEKWADLTTIVFPYSRLGDPGRDSFVKTLCSGPNIQTVSFPPTPFGVRTWAELTKDMNLKAIEIRATVEYCEAIDSSFMREVQKSARLSSLVVWTGLKKSTPRLPDVAAPDPSFCPMGSAPPEIIERIWSRVFFFAMVEDRQGVAGTLSHVAIDRNINFKRLSFLLVSKTFHRLALPYLYGYPAFTSKTPVVRFIQQLQKNPELCVHLREMEMFMGGFHWMNFQEVDMLPIASRLVHLERLVGDGKVRIRWSALSALAALDVAGPTLREFSGYRVLPDRDVGHVGRFGSISRSDSDDDSSDDDDSTPTPHSFTIFRDLVALQALTWDSDITFSAAGGGLDALAGALPELTRLEAKSPEILPLLAQMNLPKLTQASISCNMTGCAPFLQKHGSKLTKLTTPNPTVEGTSVFALCPLLTSYTLELENEYRIPPDRLEFASCDMRFPTKHAALEQLVVNKYKNYGSKAREMDDWALLFAKMNFDDFPALREIRISACEWPTTEHAISKSLWVKHAEALFKRGIKLTDRLGVHWRPRLKHGRR
ncbi:hypothetical protein B0H11DRAFT_2019845 [Mycena galericulata]|nr:hypothetical protein B0H11DRAFT_2019845 [Mycena galericulata]